ncbi:hypothetical protein [Mixta calida]|nr:hypothetical protein [Mixta calida]
MISGKTFQKKITEKYYRRRKPPGGAADNPEVTVTVTFFDKRWSSK